MNRMPLLIAAQSRHLHKTIVKLRLLTVAVAAGAAVGAVVGAVLAVRLEPARHEGGPHRHKSSRQMILQIADTLARLNAASTELSR